MGYSTRKRKSSVWPKHSLDCYFQTKDRRHEQKSSACSNATGPPDRRPYRAVTCEEHCSLSLSPSSRAQLLWSAWPMCWGRWFLMLNSKTQILMGFAAGHQTPQRPARKSRTVTTKLFFYINVEGTTMTLCFIQTHVLLQDHSDRKFCYCLTWEQKTWKLKGHSVLFKCKRIGILVS